MEQEGYAMTRKRFIKLVMAHEIQRDHAALISRHVNDFGTYEKLYRNIEGGLLFFLGVKKIRRQLYAVSSKAACSCRNAFLIDSEDDENDSKGTV